jgi:hypothetical protein
VAHSIEIKARYEKPSQALVVMDRKEGLVFAEKLHVGG